MATIHRYSKPTIRGQVWESSIVENEGNIVLHETHERMNPCKVIKNIVKSISQQEADIYKERNKQFHIETYTTNSNQTL